MNNNSTTNRIPTSQVPLVALGMKALAGADTLGVDLGLEHNSALAISVDLYDLIGDPVTPEADGKQGLYAAAKEALASARQAAKIANKAGQEFCRQSIALLKPILGNIYNPAWETAGFLGRSLAAPEKPVPMLIQLRQYFERHPAHGNVALDLTANGALGHINAVQAAGLALTNAETARIVAKTNRDGAVEHLHQRMSNLRGELSQLLADDDGRWYDFGFNRPIDSRIPGPVTGIVLTPMTPGVVAAAWNQSTLASNYRVSWRVVASGAEWTEVGLFNDRSCMITGLPSGASVVIGISARNKSGETARTEATITVP